MPFKMRPYLNLFTFISNNKVNLYDFYTSNIIILFSLFFTNYSLNATIFHSYLRAYLLAIDECFIHIIYHQNIP